MITDKAYLVRVFRISDLRELPPSARFYKKVGGRDIYKDTLTDKFWIVEKGIMSYQVEEWRGECRC